MRRKLFLIVLTTSLLLSSIISIYVIHNLQGNARVINSWCNATIDQTRIK